MSCASRIDDLYIVYFPSLLYYRSLIAYGLANICLRLLFKSEIETRTNEDRATDHDRRICGSWIL